MRKNIFAYLLLIPPMGFLSVWYLVPFIQNTILSFRSADIAQKGVFIGLANYHRALIDPRVLNSLVVTIVYTLATIGGLVVAGLLIALVIDVNFRGRTIIRGLIILPWMIPLISSVLVWHWATMRYGIANYILIQSGLVTEPVGWYSIASRAMLLVISFTIWKFCPMVALIILAGLQSIPRLLYEAAKVDGANRLQQFWHVTLPGLRSVGSVLILLLFVWTFSRSFPHVYLLTEGGPVRATDIMSINIYFTAFRKYQMGYAAAIGMIVMLILTAVSLLYTYWQKRITLR